MPPGAPQSLLLARLASGAPARAGEVPSIVAHLHALLNARQGTSLASPGYGLLDLLPLLKTFPDSRQALCERLRAAIAAYEPRLVRVRITQVQPDAAQTLQFRIDAELRDGGPLYFTTRVVDGQHLEVEP